MTTSSEVAAAVADSGAFSTLLTSAYFQQTIREIACAALAAIFTITWLHPIDVVKTRIQIAAKNSNNGDFDEDDGGVSYASLIRSVAANEGRSAFYRGITAAWIAEAVYYGLQLGLYEPLKKSLSIGGAVGKTTTERAPSKFSTKLLAGAFAGSFGAITGNPFVVVRTRMVADTGPRKSLARHVREMLRETGPPGFYRGLSAMFVRCVVLSASKMATYDTCKTLVRKRFSLDDGLALRFWSAFVAGFFITATVMPFDMIRTRMMLPPSDQNDEPGGKSGGGFVQCAREVFHQYPGISGFYRGAHSI